MSAKKAAVSNDDLTPYIYDTIDRLERLAKRLESYAETQGLNDDDDPADPIQRGRKAAKQD